MTYEVRLPIDEASDADDPAQTEAAVAQAELGQRLRPVDVPAQLNGDQDAGELADGPAPASADIERQKIGHAADVDESLGEHAVSQSAEVRTLVADPEREMIDTTEAAEHIAGIGSEGDAPPGEICDRYGYKAVALADALTRAVLEEDEVTERLARELLEIELETHRKDFALWNAALDAPDTDPHYEATGIVSQFNQLDQPNLPVVLTEPEATVDPRIAAIPDVFKSDVPVDPDEGVRPDLFTWLAGLSDDQLLNYLQWSDYRTAEVTAALQTQREEIERNVREDFDYLITDGLAPESAREALDRGIAHTRHFGALTAIESGFYNCAGLYDGCTRRLGVQREYTAAEVDKYTRFSHRVFLHEELHATDFANGMGLIYLQSNKEEPLTWVDEAVKEHLTVAGMNGQSDTLNPADRSDDGGYPELRELLHLVLTGGKFEIELPEVTSANFEPFGAETHHRQTLYERLRASYQGTFGHLPPGQTILHVIAKQINAAPKPHKADVVRGWIKKMYYLQPPEYREGIVMVDPTDRAILNIGTEAVEQ